MTMHSHEECAQALDKIDLVRSRTTTEEQFGLNDTCITFSSSGAQVDILIEEEPDPVDGRFALEEFRKAICAWQDFLKTPDAECKVQVNIA